MAADMPCCTEAPARNEWHDCPLGAMCAVSIALIVSSLATGIPEPLPACFFSSRRRHTRCPRDWSSDVCSSDLALLAVLETLSPAERVAFVLHDTFGVSFDEIAPIVGRSPAASRQLASRARRRVRGAATVPDADLARQREVVDAFLAAARDGDFHALVAVLDPDVVLRADYGAVPPDASREVRGSRAVAEGALAFARRAPFARAALVNGAAGVVVAPNGRPLAVMGFTVARGKIAEIDILADPERLSRLDLVAVLDD